MYLVWYVCSLYTRPSSYNVVYPPWFIIPVHPDVVVLKRHTVKYRVPRDHPATASMSSHGTRAYIAVRYSCISCRYEVKQRFLLCEIAVVSLCALAERDCCHEIKHGVFIGHVAPKTRFLHRG